MSVILTCWRKMVIKIICFKVHPSSGDKLCTSDYRDKLVENITPIPDFEEELIDWNNLPSSDKSLSNMLLQQVKNSMILLYRIERESNIDMKDKRIKNNMENYRDVLMRDIDAFLQKDFNIDTHAIILLYKLKEKDPFEYYGHIYVWKSPVGYKVPNNCQKEYCICMGIRARIDIVLLKNTEKELKGISYILLEGVRQFSIQQGCNSIIIYRPFPVMEYIGSKIGFKESLVDEDAVGKSIGCIVPGEICDHCMELTDISTRSILGYSSSKSMDISIY